MSHVVIGGLGPDPARPKRLHVVHLLHGWPFRPVCGTRIKAEVSAPVPISALEWRRVVTCRRCRKRRAP